MVKSLKRFIESYPGSSFPTLCETDDGTTCVLKMRGAGNGSASLISEYLVNRIAVKARLPVPDVFVVEIPLQFPWEYGTDEFYDLVRHSAGPNLGLTWIKSASPIPDAEYSHLPADLVSQVVSIDLIFANVDRSLKSRNLLQDSQGSYWIIDHGGCRAPFRDSPKRSHTLFPHHAFSGQEDRFDRTWFQFISKNDLISVVGELPDVWLSQVNTTREQIIQRLVSALR